VTPTVTFYDRPGCHLCEEALAVVSRVRERVGFTLQQRNIETDDRWMLDYLERIPVVVIDGQERFELFVDERAFELALRAVE
jgi:glutaredoxin